MGFARYTRITHSRQCCNYLIILDGGNTPYWKSYLGHNSAADCPISVKFCVGKQFSQNFGNETDRHVLQNVFLPRDAMHKRGLCRHAVSVCLSVCPSRSWILSKRINISSKFFHFRVAKPFWFFATKRYGNIPTGTPSRGVECRCGRQKSRFWPISGFTAYAVKRSSGTCSKLSCDEPCRVSSSSSSSSSSEGLLVPLLQSRT